MATKKKLAANSPLALAHAQRKQESARVKAMSPEKRTKEIAPSYVSRAIKAIKKVGVLGSARIDGEPKFQLTKEQVDRILAALRYEVEQLDGRLHPGEGKNKAKSEFTF